MRQFRLFALSIITCLVANNSQAQSGRVVDLGANGFTNAVWYDSANGIAWVGGMNFTGVDTATMWSIDVVDTVVSSSLEPLKPGGRGEVLTISRNGLPTMLVVMVQFASEIRKTQPLVLSLPSGQIMDLSPHH